MGPTRQWLQTRGDSAWVIVGLEQEWARPRGKRSALDWLWILIFSDLNSSKTQVSIFEISKLTPKIMKLFGETPGTM